MGWLQPGWSGICQWAAPSAGESNGITAIGLRAGVGQLYLSYALRVGDGEPEAVAETVSITHVPCGLGGSRPFFICPGDAAAGCGRRVLKLYLSHRYFLCRHCGQLVHSSLCEQPRQRSFRRVHKLWQRLGIVDELSVPGKPEGMSLRQYERLLDATLKAEAQADKARADRLQRLVTWVSNRTK
jgi:hypothetical protein